MENKTIITRQDLNAAVANLYAHTLNMCNEKTLDDVLKNFVEAKDYLIAIYKYNVDKYSSEENKHE